MKVFFMKTPAHVTGVIRVEELSWTGVFMKKRVLSGDLKKVLFDVAYESVCLRALFCLYSLKIRK